MKKYIISILLSVISLNAFSQSAYLGKRILVDLNVSASSKKERPFDLNDQVILFGGFDKFDGKYKWWEFNTFFSADVEAIMWKKGSIMLQAKYIPSSDYVYTAESVSDYYYDAHESSLEYGIAYRQYCCSSSRAPFGRYLQLGVSRVQLSWDDDELKYEKNLKKSKPALSGEEDFYSASFEIGYCHLFFEHLRLSLAMRTDVPFLYDASKNDESTAAYYAVRHYWCTNLFSMKLGIGYLLF